MSGFFIPYVDFVSMYFNLFGIVLLFCFLYWDNVCCWWCSVKLNYRVDLGRKTKHLLFPFLHF